MYRLGPALAAGPRAAPPRFPDASPGYTSSAAEAQAPVLASASGRCAHPTRPGGLHSSALVRRPPRLNPESPLGFLGRLRSGGDFLPAPPPPRHEGKCFVRTDARYFFFFLKLTELHPFIPTPSISPTA